MTTVFIAGISSDIGAELVRLYAARGATIVGAYRDRGHVPSDLGNATLFPCDLSRREAPAEAARAFAATGKHWDIYVSSVGQLSPIGPFLESEADDWTESVSVNGAAQLALFHALAPYRRVGAIAKLAFLVGGGINGPFRNYSAYCLGKVMLVKFCELIDDEYPDIHAVALGTGWVATKIHDQTLASGEKAGANLQRTRDFIASGQKGTTCEDILACLDWCFAQGRDVTGGRNFSIVHDPWRGGGAELARALAADPNHYKLRRRGS